MWGLSQLLESRSENRFLPFALAFAKGESLSGFSPFPLPFNLTLELTRFHSQPDTVRFLSPIVSRLFSRFCVLKSEPIN